MAKTLGVYTYVVRGVEYDMPFVEMIRSVVPIADEIVILTDSTFEDGTIKELRQLEEEIPRLKVIIEKFDWCNPGIDGISKATARSACTSDILMQMDADEIVREKDYGKIEFLKNNWPDDTIMISTGVVNWFNGYFLNLDAAGWVKERLSLNSENITHGIPRQLRIPVDGTDYYKVQPFKSDGAGYITKDGRPIYASMALCGRDQKKIFRDINNPQYIYIHHCSYTSLPRKWEMKNAWHYMWGILNGKYTCPEDYTINEDNEPVNFFAPKDTKPPASYIQPITDEMQKKRLVKCKNVKYPKAVQGWVDKQRIYVPKDIRKFRFSEFQQNMKAEVFKMG